MGIGSREIQSILIDSGVDSNAIGSNLESVDTSRLQPATCNAFKLITHTHRQRSQTPPRDEAMASSHEADGAMTPDWLTDREEDEIEGLLDYGAIPQVLIDRMIREVEHGSLQTGACGSSTSPWPTAAMPTSCTC